MTSHFSQLISLTDDALDVTSEPDDQNLAIASSSSLTQSKLPLSASHMPSKFAQLEVELGGSVTLQCPQGNSIEIQYKSPQELSDFLLRRKNG